jgi:hypothetical protein
MSLLVVTVLFFALNLPINAQASPGCKDFRFFGLHGTNENGPEVDGDAFGGMGPTVWAIWKSLQRSSRPGSIDFEAGRLS